MRQLTKLYTKPTELIDTFFPPASCKESDRLTDIEVTFLLEKKVISYSAMLYQSWVFHNLDRNFFLYPWTEHVCSSTLNGLDALHDAMPLIQWKASIQTLKNQLPYARTH
jgi:hypothetical protein